MKKGILKDLFFSFAKIGMFTFGGGYAMIALIENECVEKKGWITTDDLFTVTAIAESTPGPIAINCATFTGYMQAGFAGAVSATLGMITPSFLIIYLISMLFDNFLEITFIASALTRLLTFLAEISWHLTTIIILFKCCTNLQYYVPWQGYQFSKMLKSS